jgi:tellurite resistance protein
MGLLQKLVASTENVPIGDVQQAVVRGTMAGLDRLRPELETDPSVQLVARTWNLHPENISTPGADYTLDLVYPAPNPAEDAYGFLAVHFEDLRPVLSRLVGQHPEVDERFVLMQRILATENGEARLKFHVASELLCLPAGRHQLIAVLGVVTLDGVLRVVERLPLLVDLQQDQMEEIVGEAATNLSRKEMLSLIVGLSLFVAFADGEMEEVEEAQIVRVLVDIEDPPIEQRAQLSADLRRIAGAFRYQKSILDRLCAKARVSIPQGAQQTLMSILFSVATADGVLHANEEKILRYVNSQMGLPLEAVQTRIDEFFSLN